MMAEASEGWLGLVALILLPFPALAFVAMLDRHSIRKCLARSLEKNDDLSRQAVLREAILEESTARLQDVLASHDKLTREFHHRVKNSLQIIQSYLTLSRRQRSAPHNSHLAEAEAKVQVISSAYRLALSDGTMAPIPIRIFVLGIVENAQAILGRSSRRISASVSTEAVLPIDRAIPLGLAIIETIIAALASDTVMYVGFRLHANGSDDVALRATIDDLFARVDLPLRLMAGLQSQLEAQVQPRAANEVLHWHFPV